MNGDMHYFPPGDALLASPLDIGVTGMIAGGKVAFAAHLLQNSFAGGASHKVVGTPADEERAG